MKRLLLGILQSPARWLCDQSNVPVEEHIGRVGVNYKFTNCLFLFNCGAVVAKY
jgi:hypothetical protein